MPKILFKLEKEIKTIQENQSTEEIYSEQLLKSRDDIKKLENQLEVVQKRCGEAMSENTNLRGSIDHLLLERWVTFIAFLHVKILSSWNDQRQLNLVSAVLDQVEQILQLSQIEHGSFCWRCLSHEIPFFMALPLGKRHESEILCSRFGRKINNFLLAWASWVLYSERL